MYLWCLKTCFDREIATESACSCPVPAALSGGDPRVPAQHRQRVPSVTGCRLPGLLAESLRVSLPPAGQARRPLPSAHRPRGRPGAGPAEPRQPPKREKITGNDTSPPHHDPSTHSLKLSTAPAFTSSVLRRDGESASGAAGPPTPLTPPVTPAPPRARPPLPAEQQIPDHGGGNGGGNGKGRGTERERQRLRLPRSLPAVPVPPLRHRERRLRARPRRPLRSGVRAEDPGSRPASAASSSRRRAPLEAKPRPGPGPRGGAAGRRRRTGPAVAVEVAESGGCCHGSSGSSAARGAGGRLRRPARFSALRCGLLHRLRAVPQVRARSVRAGKAGGSRGLPGHGPSVSGGGG